MMKQFIGLIKKIYRVLDNQQRKEVVLLLVIIVLNSLFELLGVSAILPLITAVTDPSAIEQKAYFRVINSILEIENTEQTVVVLSFVLVIVYIIKNAFILLMNHTLYKCTYRNQRKLSVRLVNSYMKQDYSYHVKHNIAEIERNVGDANTFFSTVQYLLQLMIEILVCFALAIFLMIVDVGTTLVIVFLMVILLFLFVRIYKDRMKQLGKLSREYTALKNQWFLQSFNGIKEIKTTNKEAYFLEQYDSMYKKSAEVMQKNVFLSSIPKPVVETISICSILIFMAVRILMGSDLSSFVPTLSVFAVAAFRMLPSFNRISGNLSTIMFSKASVDAVYNGLIEISELENKEQKHNINENIKLHLNDQLELRNVVFAYPTKPDVIVLKGINITIPSKKAVAFVGSSGAGKTTVADILMGLYEPLQGTVAVDGINIYENIRAWHNIIGYIPQSIYMIDDTIRANVAFGIPREQVDDDKVWKALEDAQLAEFVRKQEKGLDSNIGDRGVKVSGGQRQRIGIARALYNQPELLILDEATSALDNETEEAVMDAIYRLSGRVTMVVIAHRLTTIKDCDIIYEIKDGRAQETTYEKIKKPEQKNEHI